jgi:hypothetical protein
MRVSVVAGIPRVNAAVRLTCELASIVGGVVPEGQRQKPQKTIREAQPLGQSGGVPAAGPIYIHMPTGDPESGTRSFTQELHHTRALAIRNLILSIEDEQTKAATETVVVAMPRQ